MAVPPPLRVELLGGFRIFADGRSLAKPPSARQQQLIAFLVLHARSAPIQRQRVGGSLWPESSDVQALTNLRRELHHLREGWPRLDALVDVGSRTLAWHGEDGAIVDLVAFEAAADRGLEGDRAALQKAARLYKGDLLPECTGEWIDADRERLRQRARKVLAHLVGLLEHDRAFGDAIEHAQQLLRLDPLDEQAWCALMRCHARRGERATALHLYQQCAAVLKKELGIQPSAATRITYREILDLDAAAPVSPAPPRTAVYPLVGRQSEWQALLNAWRAAAAGRTRLFLIRGEAGIGKTRLAEELVDWSRLNGITPVTTRCYAGEGRLAYAPIAAWLKSDALRPALMKLDPSWMTDVSRLRPELLADRPEVPAPDRQLEGWQRLRFFEALAQAFRSAAPLVLVVDDLQWADGDTIEWLQYFVRSASDTRCLVVGTVRAEEEQDNPPLGRLLGQLERDNLLTMIALGPLDRTATAQLAGEVAEHPLDETALVRTFRETEGHPLFIIERGRMELAKQPGSPGDNPLPQVQSVVAARLALLSEDARAAAQVAAAVGRDFRFDILAQASDLEEDALVRALDELWRRHIVRVQADERWDFSHDRIREVTYGGIEPARRRLIHRRIAQGMELLFATRLDDVSASISVHLDRGGQPARAVPFLERAAAVATRVSANEEAIRCLTHALSLVQTLPPGRDRDEQELSLRSSLSIALNSARGYAAPEVEQNLDRVFTLSRAERHGQVPVRWLWAAFGLRFVLGDLKGALELSEQALAYSVSDPSCRCEAHHAMGGTLLSLGELDASRHHFEAALAAYDEEHPQRSALGSDLGVFAHAWYAHTLWLLGDENTAVAHAEEGIALARRLDHMYSQTLALAYAALLHQMRLDSERALACAEAAVALCERYGFAYYGDWAHALIGWARGRERPAEGVEIIESALERLDRNRAQARRPYYLSLLAETYSRLGNRDRTASILDAAIATALERGDVWWLPALYLQKSELEPAPERETTLWRGLVLTRTQNSRSLEQRILASSIASSI
ncbi:MAG TPA: AAA family ATPase [Vicinamibacterales bacterium]|nr:AAA family ATPase [Vicinamibacterales bacterium]